MQGQFFKYLKLLWIQAMVTRSSAHHVHRIAATELKFESQYVDKNTLWARGGCVATVGRKCIGSF